MSNISYMDSMYDDQIKSYNTLGEDLLYYANNANEYIKISNISNDQIRKEIYILNSTGFWPMNKGWVDIFKDVLHNRRMNKLKKIKSNIK